MGQRTRYSSFLDETGEERLSGAWLARTQGLVPGDQLRLGQRAQKGLPGQTRFPGSGGTHEKAPLTGRFSVSVPLTCVRFLVSLSLCPSPAWALALAPSQNK